jgi:lipoate-protein ligase A
MSFCHFDGMASPRENMEKDRALLACQEEPFLRFYTWPWPSCTWGFFVDPEKLLKKEALADMPNAQRPTGGGLLFHGRDLAFSLFLPSGHPLTTDSFNNINGPILRAIMPLLKESYAQSKELPSLASSSPCHFCQAKATEYDLLVGIHKIGGTAERKTKRGVLHQTSLFLYPPDWEFLSQSVKDKQQVVEMRKSTLSLSEMVRDLSFIEIPFLVERLSSALMESLG